MQSWQKRTFLLSDGGSLPARFIAGDAMGAIEQKQAAVQEQIEANRALSAALSYNSWKHQSS
jgi:hypothetical protein